MSFRFPRDVFDGLSRLSRREERTKTAIVTRAIRGELVAKGEREGDLLERDFENPVDDHARRGVPTPKT